MDVKSFTLRVIELIKGTLAGKVILALITGGLTILGAAPFFDKYISAALSQYLNLTADDPSTYIGIFLIVLGVVLFVWERKNQLSLEERKINSSSINDEISSSLKRQEFLSYKKEVEEQSYDIIKRLIHKHHDIGYVPTDIQQLGKTALFGSKEAVVQYLDRVLVGNTDAKVKLDLYLMLGDATGQPIIYKFVSQYRTLIETAEKEGFKHLVLGTPLHQAYLNVIHPSFVDLRRQAYWEDFV